VGGWYVRGKPALDFALAVALLPPALVLVALAALAVKLTSAGPAFYTQTRVGRNGRRFTILKLRTMRHRCEAQTGPCWSRPADARVTRVGRFLRATHLDELPQLWNVLRGDMSLVGPRPERPEIIESENLARIVPGYGERLSVKPGVTGLAQLLLPPDADVESVLRKVACDRAYIRRAGLWLDLRILVGTLFKALGVGPRTLGRVLALPRADGPAPRAKGDTAERMALRVGEPESFPEGWREALTAVLVPPPAAPPEDAGRAEVRAWFPATVVPALRELAAELRGHGRRVRLSDADPEEAGLRVWGPDGCRELDLKFRVRYTPVGPRAYARELVRDGQRDFVHEHALDRPLAELTSADILALAVARYRAVRARGDV
jgi:lipopolysaccharide/colanic/teichoic acid biosynthesis glycosyltransferase